jgi:organic hydroperoxide reductase OsmC/OhrA
VSAVTLRPAVSFDGQRRPTPSEIDALHHRAHEECFIANSVRTEVSVIAAAA